MSRYSTFDLELLAAYASICHFQSSIKGRRCMLSSDHKPLTQALHSTSNPWSSRQQRHLGAIAEFIADVQCLPGPENHVADALSHFAVSSVSLGVDFESLAQ